MRSGLALVTPEEMALIDRRAAARGPFDGFGLMRNAGAAVLDEILAAFADCVGVDVLCGPGNNGGDGYVVGRLLAERGVDTAMFALRAPPAGSDAARAVAACPVPAADLAAFTPRAGRLVVDGLFGAGLARPVDGLAGSVVERVNGADSRVLAIDLPSGVCGRSGAVLGTAFKADRTITFFRRKPGHLLYPGRALCGIVRLADIGIPGDLLDRDAPPLSENAPALWTDMLPEAAFTDHKYTRGHVAVLTGGVSSSGAARLAARGAARAGAGAVTLLSPSAALAVNAAHVTAIMLRRADTAEQIARFIEEKQPSAVVMGPGAGVGHALREAVLAVLGKAGRSCTLVLDADAITSFADAAEALFAAIGGSGCAVVLTPHAGEFSRLFPDLAGDERASKVERARSAARRSGASMVLKGADTVIAAPDGRAAINTNAPAHLATAGSGDVLAGLVAGLAAQDMPAFEAAAAAVWMHGEAGRIAGRGLLAEDLPETLPFIWKRLSGS